MQDSSNNKQFNPLLFSRRGFLTTTGASVLGAALVGHTTSRFASAQRLGNYPFTLGVASGDPLPDGVVLWTRLAPDPLNAEYACSIVVLMSVIDSPATLAY